jgi:paraquat-inducible protein B
MQTTDADVNAGGDAPASPSRPRLVGVFGLVGLALIVGGLALLSSSRAFGQRRTFVAFFGNPVGLKAGSPVTFRQTPVGEVRTVEMVLTGRGFESETMVVFDIARASLRSIGRDVGMQKLDDRSFAEALAKAGLRASVRSSSPVGGSKSLDFDFRPEVPARLTGLEAPYPEVPTGSLSRLDVLQGKVEKALEKVADLPLEETVEQVRATLESAQKLLDSGDLKGALADLRRVLATADRVVSRAEGTLDQADGLMGDVRTTLSRAQETMKATDGTLARLDTSLSTVDRNVERTADTQHQMIRSIDELNEVLRAIRQLVDTLQQHPEALLQGKPAPKKENDR